MTGPRRLAVFASLVWIAVIGFLSIVHIPAFPVAALDFFFDWRFWLAIGVAPVALASGLSWFAAGFRRR